jgi:hypothetical protein
MSLNYAGRAWAIITNTPGTAGTTFVVTTGQGARVANGAQTTAARVSALNDPGSVEWVQLTTRATDTFTSVTRNYDGGGVLNIQPGLYALDVVEDLAAWNAIAFDSSFFAAIGGGALTVDSGDRVNQRWKRVGSTILYRMRVKTATITGVVSNLSVLFPTAALPAGSLSEDGPYPVMLTENNGTTWILGFAFWAAGADRISIFKADGTNFAVVANLLGFSFVLPIEAP